MRLAVNLESGTSDSVRAAPAALHFDFTSPASVVAVLRLHTFLARGADVGFVGIDMLGLAIAIPVSQQLIAERNQWAAPAATLGCVLGTPRWQPPTAKAHLVHQLAQQQGLGATWREQVMTAYWHDGAAIDDRDVLIALGQNSGLSAAAVSSVLDNQSMQRTLLQQMTQNRKRGIGAVPVLEVHGNFVSPHLDDPDLAGVLMVPL